MSQLKYFCLWLSLLQAGIASAAVSKSIVIEGALRQPLEQRTEFLQKQGLRAQHELTKIAFNQSADLQTRWRAITSLGRVYKGDAADTLEKALLSREWFMRNAALIAAPHVGRAWAIAWSQKMLNDPALVVRTAAVQTLRELDARETANTLWQKLYAQENYRAGYSLWVRRHILEALAQFAKPGEEGSFVVVLSDRDESLHPIAMKTLEKLSNQKYITRDQWQSWWQNRKRI